MSQVVNLDAVIVSCMSHYITNSLIVHGISNQIYKSKGTTNLLHDPHRKSHIPPNTTLCSSQVIP